MTPPHEFQVDDVIAHELEAYQRSLEGEDTHISAARTDPVAAEPVRTRIERAKRCLDLLWAAGPETGERAATPQAFDLPTAVGRFQIQAALGSGGFGIVYRAVDPVTGRQVALKIPKIQAFASPELLLRFQHEAAAAAKLDHPNIVPVLEAGLAGSVPYIATTYYDGPTLAQWLAARREPVATREAAQFVRKLAAAVQHAHARGVLHRDIKPSNVLLAPRDDQPDAPGSLADFEPKLLDFGLAKLTESTPDLTRSGAILGTIRYMAPEQARGDLRAITTATDVYSLGVCLYELLTGQPLFESANDADLLLKITTTEPRRPRHVRAEVPADLETICLTCLANDPRHRYRSAGELGDDLARYLAGEPIWSRPVSRVERYSKWCARNPWICLTSGIALASLLVSWGLTVRNNYELRQVNRRVEEERNTAETQRQSAVTARDEADRSQELALKAFQDLVDGVQQKLLTRPATEDLRRDLLATAQRGLEELAKNGGPAEASISKTYLTSLLQLADIYHMYGDSTGANRIHEQALSYAQQMQHAHPNDAELQMGLATIYLARSSLRRTRGKLQATRLDLETALRIQQALVDADPTNWTAQAAVAQTCGSLGHLAVAGSDLSSAFDYFRRSLRIQEQLIERDSDDAEAYVSLATMHRMLGDLFLFEREDAVKAKDCYLAAFHVTAQAAAIDPNNHRFWLTFAAVYRGLADTALRQGEEPLARAHYHKYLEWAVKISSAEPNSTRANGELRVAYERLGDQACRDQNWKDAHGAFLQELKVLARDVWGSPEIGLHVNTDYLVAMFLKLGDVRSAAQCLAMSRSILEATQKVDADRNLCLRMAALNHLRQADLAIQSESLTEAQAACSLAVQSAEQLVQLQSQGPDSQLVLAQCLLRQGTVQIQLALDHDNGYVTLNRSRRLLQEMPRPERPRHASRHEQLIADVDQMLLIGQSVAAAHQDLEVITKLQSEVRTDLLKLHGLDAIRHGNVELAIQSAEALNRVDDSDIRACFEAACLFGRCASQPIVAASPDTPGSATRDLSEKCLAQVGLILEHCEQHDFFRDIDQLGQLLSRPELASFRKTRSEHPVIKKYAGLLTP